MADHDKRTGDKATGDKAGARDIARTTWVLVPSPGGVPNGTPLEVAGQLGAGETGDPFQVILGRNRFHLEHDGTVWSTAAECTPARPKDKPQRIDLVRVGAGPRQAARPGETAEWGRVMRPRQQARLVTGSGKRPGAQTVIYVHGIGNKPEASVLECQWDTALFGAPMGDRTRMAYWVDRDRYPSPLDATCGDPDRTATDDDEATTATIMALAARAAPSEGPGREEVALEREIAALAQSEQQRRTLERIAERIADGVQEEAPPPPAARPGRASARLFPVPLLARETLARLFTRVLLRDVHDFLFDAGKRDLMTGAVWERMRGGGEPFVVVAHSQGSMVAYELLRRLRPEDCDVALFVTIGSPLGLQEVQDHFRRAGGLLHTPACVGRWVNVADRLDPVALDPTLADEYRPNARGVSVEDRVEWWLNPDSPRDPHSGTGYLRSAEVRDAVRLATGSAFAQPISRSVISRDVAADTADGDERVTQDVLIQLADPDADGAGVPQSLDQIADELIARLRGLAAGRPGGLKLKEPDRMRRFVRAELTRTEIEALRTLSADLKVQQVWSNARKRTMVHVSAATVQATTANLGYAATGRGIGWAVLDTGIDARHPHFRAHKNVRAQWDCLEPGEAKPLQEEPDRPRAADGNGHGTHVAAVVAGCAKQVRLDGRQTSLAGMAPETWLYGFRVLDARGEGSDATIIKALDKVADINERASALVIHGVNLSLGSNFDPRIYGVGHTPLCQELRRLWRQGVLVCVAASNEGYAELRATGGTMGANLDLSIGDPANLEEAIAVGSVHKSKPHTYGVSYFSSRGPTADGRRKPDLVAPGERILSAMAHADGAPEPDGVLAAEEWYVEMSGTSMATPHVSGVLAAFLSARREFIGEPDRVKRILLAGCTDLGRDPNMQGAGLVNLVKMLVAT